MARKLNQQKVLPARIATVNTFQYFIVGRRLGIERDVDANAVIVAGVLLLTKRFWGHDMGKNKATIREKLLDLAAVASDGRDVDPLTYRELCDPSSGVEKNARQIAQAFECIGVNNCKLLKSDIERVVQGGSPEFFLSHHRWAHLYRKRRGISEDKSESESEDISEIWAGLEKQMEKHAKEYEKYGVSRAMLDDGFACPYEHQYFYKTEEWQKTAKARRAIAGYQCKRCGTSDEVLEVHHGKPIISVMSKPWARFAVNFAGWNLSVLCSECHRQYHDKTVRDDTHFHKADSEKVDAEKEHFRKLKKYHDELGGCAFCDAKIAERYPPDGEWT